MVACCSGRLVTVFGCTTAAAGTCVSALGASVCTWWSFASISLFTVDALVFRTTHEPVSLCVLRSFVISIVLRESSVIVLARETLRALSCAYFCRKCDPAQSPLDLHVLMRLMLFQDHSNMAFPQRYDLYFQETSRLYLCLGSDICETWSDTA